MDYSFMFFLGQFGSKGKNKSFENEAHFIQIPKHFFIGNL